MSQGDWASNRAMTANSTVGVAKAESSDEHFERTVERAVSAAVIQAADPSRRRFLAAMGTAALTALVAELFPLKQIAAFAADPVGKPEKTDLSIGFIPITCATPIIMAEPLGFYSKHGLNAKVKRAAGWAMIRDWAVNKTCSKIYGKTRNNRFNGRFSRQDHGCLISHVGQEVS